MKKLLLISLSLLFFTAIGVSQNVSGTITDTNTGEPLIGASITIEGTTMGTTTDMDGKFSISGLSPGTYSLHISYLGYSTEEQIINVTSESKVLGTIQMTPAGIGLEEILVVSDVAIDRKTPVAVSTISGTKIEEVVGNQEYPEVLRSTPSVYVTKLGGGFGDARINIRGFNQRNFAVMINGIPVNDMENGWVYWSNWAGLSDVTSRIQVQRGLGATKLAAPTVGGSINIITNPAEFNRGGAASVTYGNDNFIKAAASYSTGLGEKGWAATFQLTHTRGDGYADGTAFRAYSFFGAISKSSADGKHMLALTALGAPQWHHQRLGASRFDNISLRTFFDPDGIEENGNQGLRWNHTWGTLDGEEFNWRRNFYHKPKVFLNHYWNINEKTDLKTSAYVSFGRGGGTGPRGRLRTPGSIFDSFGGFGAGTHNADGQVRFDDLVRYNQGQQVSGWGDAKQRQDGQYLVTSDGRFYFPDGSRNNNGSGFIRRASMNYHNWYGILSTLSTSVSDEITLVSGIDWRYYKGIHFRRLENLLGADGYFSRSNVNNPMNIITEPSEAKFGNFADNSYKDDENPNILNYYNDGLVNWFGLFGQLEYAKDDLTAFVSFSGSNQGFKRIDYFIYEETDPIRESDWENFLGGTVKAGLNYNLSQSTNVFINAGIYSKQPIFDNVYINFQNEVNPDIDNQNVYAVEGGYGYRTANFKMKLNAYYTEWTDRQFDQSIDLPNGEDGLALFRGVGQTHIGLELEGSYAPASRLSFDYMLSVGDWKYTSDFTADIQNIDTQQPAGTATIFADGLKIADAAQTTFSIGANYELIDDLRLWGTVYHAANLYAQYDIQDPQFFTPGGKVIKLPDYSLVDIGATYNFNFSGTRASLRANINNLLDKTYISEAFTNIPDNPNTPWNELYDNRGHFGFGRTWNTTLKVFF